MRFSGVKGGSAMGQSCWELGITPEACAVSAAHSRSNGESISQVTAAGASERSIVAMNSAKVDGAKGPWQQASCLRDKGS